MARAQRNGKEVAEHFGYSDARHWPRIKRDGIKVRFGPADGHTQDESRLLSTAPLTPIIWTWERVLEASRHAGSSGGLCAGAGGMPSKAFCGDNTSVRSKRYHNLWLSEAGDDDTIAN